MKMFQTRTMYPERPRAFVYSLIKKLGFLQHFPSLFVENIITSNKPERLRIPMTQRVTNYNQSYWPKHSGAYVKAGQFILFHYSNNVRDYDKHFISPDIYRIHFHLSHSRIVAASTTQLDIGCKQMYHNISMVATQPFICSLTLAIAAAAPIGSPQ